MADGDFHIGHFFPDACLYSFSVDDGESFWRKYLSDEFGIRCVGAGMLAEA